MMDNKHYLRRGNLMWEGSRMILTEHRQALLEYDRKKVLVDPPSPSEDDLAYFSQVAVGSKEQQAQIEIRYWQDGKNYTEHTYIEETRQSPGQIKFNGEWHRVEHIIWMEPYF